MGSQKSTTKVENPELQRTIKDARAHYQNADGSFKTPPRIDTNTPEAQARMNSLVAPQSADTLSAYQQVRDGIGGWQGDMDSARSMITSSAQPTGQKIDYQGFGWGTGADGQRTFDSQAAYDQSYNQYTGQVVDNTLSRLSDTYDKQRLNDTDAAIKAGSFGGSRQAVRDGLTNSEHMRAASEAAASGYSAAHDSALRSIGDLYNQGSSAVAANNQVDQNNRTASLAAGESMNKLAQAEGQMRAGDANALAAIGQHQQDYDQMRRDAYGNEALREFQWPATFTSMMAGASAPLSTTTTTQSGGMGSMLLGAGLQGLGMFLSDERAKKGIKKENPDRALEEIRKLTPKSFEYRDEAKAMGAPGGRISGFTAQELESATGRPSPEAGGFKGVDIAEQIGRLTHAVIALDRQVQSIGSKKRVAA